MTEEQEVFLKHIQKKGLKRTTQRDLILDIFLRTEEHLSSEDLYRPVKQEKTPASVKPRSIALEAADGSGAGARSPFWRRHHSLRAQLQAPTSRFT